jgi:hypothetical protein
MTNEFVALSCNALTGMFPFRDLERDRHFAKVKIENSQITTMGSINKIFIILSPL